MAPKAATKSKKAAPAHPKYSAMIADAIKTLNERTGSSRQAIFKHIDGKYKIGEAGKSRLRLALKRGVEKKELVNPKGHTGSFRLAAKAKAEKKPKAAKKTTKKKASAKKTSAKKPAAKKAPAKKKTSAKKAPAKKKTSAKKAAAKKA